MRGGTQAGATALWVDPRAPGRTDSILVVGAPAPAPAPGRASKPFVLGNRPALTGLRAPLIAVVLVFHSNFRVFPGAWAAVGAFFVLSGFLITSMLVTEQRKTGGINLKRFYSRRAVRLLPPLFITVAVLAVYASVVKVVDAAHTLWADVAGAVFYFADYRSALGHESAFGFLAQAWSLAIEEQFYLVWGVLLCLALKYGNRKLAYTLTLSGIAVSISNRMWIVVHATQWNARVAGRVYYAFDTRADALLVGCLLGLLATGGHLENWQPKFRRVLAGLAVSATGLLIWMIATIEVGARSVPLYWLPTGEVAMAIIISYFIVHPRSFAARALSISILVLLGNMSYAIYLLHWPVYVFFSPFTVTWPFWVEESVRLAVILSIAVATWFFVERPLMRWRRKVFHPAHVG